MTLSIESIEALVAEVPHRLSSLQSKEQIEAARREWLGKDGLLRSLFQQLRDVAPDQKPTIASKLNQIKSEVEARIEQAVLGLAGVEQNRRLQEQFIDLSLPGLKTGMGRAHPITMVERRIAEILRPFGFRTVSGPEIESEYYCFDSLNIPPHHPARDMQDTFYTSSNHVLRTHTTSVQARVLQKGGLPVKVASFGRTYRNESENASHMSMFHQFELVWIEEGLTLSNLMALITHILKGLYGKRRKVRFVPKFYPYTEPSIGPQIDCSNCGGKGCVFCGGSGWVTVAGAGMVHRNVLVEFKYDPEKVSGFAFGLGTSRLAAQFSEIKDARILYENDLRVFRALS